MSTRPSWRRVWRAVTGYSENTTGSVVEAALNASKDHLLQGVGMYVAYTKQSLQDCAKKENIKEDSFTYKLLDQISNALDLDASVTWELYCHYLMFEYHGRIDKMEELTKDQNFIKIFLPTMWQYYSLERIYMLQILQHVLEHHQDTSHKFQPEYSRFVKTITYRKIQQSLIQQFKFLFRQSLAKADSLIKFRDVVQRNNLEELRLYLLMLTTMHFEPLEINNFLELFTLVKDCRILTTAYNQESSKATTTAMLENVRQVTVAFIITGFMAYRSETSWHSHTDKLEQIVKEISSSNNRSSAILLAWAALESSIASTLIEQKRDQLRMYFNVAFSDTVFLDLGKIISHDMFKGLVAHKTILKAVFVLFDIVVVRCQEYRIYTSEGSVNLFTQFLASYDLAHLVDAFEGTHAFYSYAVAFFPHHFQPFVTFMESYLSLDMDVSRIFHTLTTLQKYTDRLYSDNKEYLVESTKLNQAYSPIDSELIVFYPGTVVNISSTEEETLVQFNGEWNYFCLVEHFVNEFFDRYQRSQLDDTIVQLVIAGYKLILKILKRNSQLLWLNARTRKLLYATLRVLSIGAKSEDTQNIHLVKMCFEIIMHFFEHDPAEIVRVLAAIGFLPKYSENMLNFQQFQTGTFLDSPTLFTLIESRASRSDELLLLYSQFVLEMTKLDMYIYKIQVTGCIYLLVKAFPVNVETFFENDSKSMKITLSLLNVLNQILLKKPESPVHSLIIDLFLKSPIHAKSLLKVVGCGGAKLLSLLLSEVNWNSEIIRDVTDILKISLTCINYLLVYIWQNKKSYPLFEDSLYYWQSNNCSILKAVSGLLNHYFDHELPKSACLLLTYFVKISNKPLLHSLQLDDYQLQSMFLEKLRDTLEEVKMQVAVINLVTACVAAQSSMTVGFFNVAPKGPESDFSILSFIDEYLDNIVENPNYLLAPVQKSLLDLFHELWKKRKHHLLSKVNTTEKFWQSLTAPIVKETSVSIDIMMEILEIITLELNYHRNNTEECFKYLKCIFENPDPFLDTWIDRLYEYSYDETEIYQSNDNVVCEALLVIWKCFMLSTKLLNPEYFYKNFRKPFVVKKILFGLSNYLKNPQRLDVVKLWGELLLIYKDFPKVEDTKEQTKIFELVLNIVSRFADCYNILDIYCRTVILTALSIILTNFKEFLRENSKYYTPFLSPLQKVFHYEYTLSRQLMSDKDADYRNWMLMLNIINTFLKLTNYDEYEFFFTQVRYVDRLVDMLNLCIIHGLSVTLAKTTALALVEYAESPLIRHFEFFNMLVISQQLLPQGNTLLQKNPFSHGVIPVHLKNWWAVYLYIVRFYHTLLRRRKGYILNDVLEFIYVHQFVLSDALLSATILVDESNVEMVIEILKFIHSILNYKQQWFLSDDHSYYNTMTNIKEILNASIGVILRPKCLVFVPNTPVRVGINIATSVPMQSVLTVMNNCVEIISWSCKCLTRYNNQFIYLLDSFKVGAFQLLVEYDFRVPPILKENLQVLTFGSLLCALHFICRVLSQIHFQEKELTIDSSTVLSSASTSATSVTHEVVLTKPYNVLILPIYIKEICANINAVHNFTVPEVSSLQTPSLNLLDPDILMDCLSTLTTFLAGQAFLTVYDETVERSLKRYVKRELCSELSQFYDFVVKYVKKKHKIEELGSGEIQEPRHTEDRKENLYVDVLRICTDTGVSKRIEVPNLSDAYVITLVHWFRHVCRLVHYSKFDEFLSKWHAKSTYVMPHSIFVKNTSVHFSDDEDE